MEALALYLWHLLSSRDESDSGEEEVDLPNVKLPEITVLRKNGEPDEMPSRTSGKRKRVSFAEPVHSYGPVSRHANSIKSQGSPRDQYKLVPVHTDHDYVPAPLVCYRRLSDGILVKTPVVVKSTDHNDESKMPNHTKSQKQFTAQRTSSKPMEKSNVTSSAVVVDPTFDRDKTYKTVYGWNELLGQFGAEPGEGDHLFNRLISALSGENEENIDGEEDKTDDDEDRDDTHENGGGFDDDSDSVEIVWEGSSQKNDSSTLKATLSVEEPTKNVHRELFEDVVDEDELASVRPKKADGSSTEQPLNGSVEPTSDIVINGNGEFSDRGCPIADSCEGQGDRNRSDEPGKTCENQDVSAELHKIVEGGVENTGELCPNPPKQSDTIELSEKTSVEFITVDTQEGVSAALAGVTADPSNSPAVESRGDARDSVSGECELDFESLCEWAVSVCQNQSSQLARKRKKNSESKTTGDQPKKRKWTRRKNPTTVKPIEELSKKQIISRLAKEIRSTHDPRDTMDEPLFKTTFGVSKEFANFLINSLSPHLAPPDNGKCIRVDRVPEYLKVLTALQFLATGNRNREIGEVLHVSQPQVSKTLSEVITALVNTAPEPELPSSDSEFSELYGLPGIIGAVDATHVPIKPPSGVGRKCKGKERFDNPLAYKNSADYFSIVVQIVSSSSNRILFCDAKLPGCSTKSWLWRKSKVRKMITEMHAENSDSVKLLAGSAYECEPWLLTPCRAVDTDSPEARYNSSLGCALQDSVRLTIGLLKGRFKCLSTASSSQLLYYTPDKAAQVITACCALHNLLMDFGEEMPVLAFDEFDLVETSDDSDETNWDGLEARNNYIIEHFY